MKYELFFIYLHSLIKNVRIMIGKPKFKLGDCVAQDDEFEAAPSSFLG